MLLQSESMALYRYCKGCQWPAVMISIILQVLKQVLGLICLAHVFGGESFEI